MRSKFDAEYEKLNTYQRKAVETLVGPVMVVAGPGTGKTQVLALRIANILKKTDIKADGILCLTFTNSAVEAMKNRLVSYIGEEGERVNISTFHSFGMQIIGEHYKILGLKNSPTLLEDIDSALLFYEILNNNKWEHLRPRGNSMRYFSDLRSIMSLLKRERISNEDFASAVKKEIKFLEEDEGSISTRGESKGQLKKDIQKQIDSLERSLEIEKFARVYERTKKEKNVLDYDDVLESLVAIVEASGEVVSDIRERYLHVLIDEHQDSSHIQNEFLKKVWGEVESPDIFVVGDDRQLIYGFSGASIDHFQGFKKTFKDATLIPLLENYRSTQVILDASHALLQSVMSDEKLVSQNKHHHPIRLIESDTTDDEIIQAGMDIKDKIKKGLIPNDCAILVPKNGQVRNALLILHDLRLPVASIESLNLFDQEEALAFLRVLKIITREDTPSLAQSFFDITSDIEWVEAHKFIERQNMREFSLSSLENRPQTLFAQDNQVEKWIQKLIKWKRNSLDLDLKSNIETIGKELFEEKTKRNKLVNAPEILGTILEILSKQLEKNPKITTTEFVSFLERLKSYGGDVPIISSKKEGIKVLTMHSSKGLEFEYVWIAHMDESSLNLGRKMGFTLPEEIKERIGDQDVDAVKRKLYVAITRAKKFCTISYSTENKKNGEQELARVIADLPSKIFNKEKIQPSSKTFSKKNKEKNTEEIQRLVSAKYKDRYVSASLLNNFFECPWKWYFRNLLQLPEEMNENLEFGIAVHSAIDEIIKMGHKPSEQDIEGLSLESEVKKVICRWVYDRLPEILTDRMSEQSVSHRDQRFPELGIYGRIDLIEKLDNKNLRVTDFKTGSVKKKNEVEKLDSEGRQSNLLRQLTMYSYLLENNPKWNGVKVSESRLEFLEAKDKKGSIYECNINKENINLLMKDIEDYSNLVKTGEWVHRPCNYNSYGKDTECEYCRMANIYK